MAATEEEGKEGETEDPKPKTEYVSHSVFLPRGEGGTAPLPAFSCVHPAKNNTCKLAMCIPRHKQLQWRSPQFLLSSSFSILEETRFFGI